MKTRVTLVVEVEHPEDVDPSEEFVYYFGDDLDHPDLDLERDKVVVEEEWEVVG